MTGSKSKGTDRGTEAQKRPPAAPSAKEVRTPAMCYERYLEPARALDSRAVLPFRIDPVLAAHNVRRGVDSVRTHQAEIAKALPAIDWSELESLPDLALAVLHAAAQVDRAPAKTNLADLMQTARRLRALMLGSAETLALVGVIPEGEVAKIREGRGAIDMASDCTALATLFTTYAQSVSGKTPVTADDIRVAADVGTTLLEMLRPRGAKLQKPENEAVKEAVELRDRMYTLLVERHETLWRVGAYLFGHDVDRRIPGLQTREHSANRPTGEPDTPIETPAPTVG